MASWRDPGGGRPLLDHSVELATQADLALYSSGVLERVDGNLTAAHRHAEEALQVAQQVGSGWMQAAFTAGAALTTNDAVAYVHRARGERKRPSHGWDSLTPTELDVVRHIAAGLTNRQIGQHMFISPGTVKAHLSHIFTKLDTPSCSHLATEATKRGLDPPT